MRIHTKSERQLNIHFRDTHLKRIGYVTFTEIASELKDNPEVPPNELAFFVSQLQQFITNLEALPEDYSLFNVQKVKQWVLRLLLHIETRTKTISVDDELFRMEVDADPRLNGNLRATIIDINSRLEPEHQLLEA